MDTQQLEQWMRQHDCITTHKPHPEVAAVNFYPWQATDGYEYRYGLTEEDACRSFAKAKGLEFDGEAEKLQLIPTFREQHLAEALEKILGMTQAKGCVTKDIHAIAKQALKES